MARRVPRGNPPCFLVLFQLILTALGHGKGVILNGSRIQGLVQREKVLEKAGRHAIGDQ